MSHDVALAVAIRPWVAPDIYRRYYTAKSGMVWIMASANGGEARSHAIHVVVRAWGVGGVL